MAGLRDIVATVLATMMGLSGITPGQEADGSMDTTSDALTGHPERVVSMNLCTDQLAMLLAAPDQLLSVSHLSTDPRGSPMAEQARSYRTNHGLAEEIWLMRPDLVIVGSFSARATVDMLRRLGVPVLVMDPAYGLDDIPDRLREMGKALGREEAAEAQVQAFETRLAALRNEAVTQRPRAALYYANGMTLGDGSLSGEIVATAGFANIAAEAGVASGGRLPLEVLAMAVPETIISGRPYPGHSRAEEILDHPVVTALRSNTVGAVLTNRDWACGTPAVLDAIDDMRDVRRGMEAQ